MFIYYFYYFSRGTLNITFLKSKAYKPLVPLQRDIERKASIVFSAIKSESYQSHFQKLSKIFEMTFGTKLDPKNKVIRMGE